MHTHRFIVCDDVAIEIFDDRALVLLCDTLELRQIDTQLCDILQLLNSKRSIIDIDDNLHNNNNGCANRTKQITAALKILVRQRIVRPVVDLLFERKSTMDETLYLANPDVSFRQEDDDGGILFNQDTDGLEVINPIAVEIWKQLASPSTADDIIDYLCCICDDARRDAVAQDVNDFLSAMLTKKFIGIVETTA